MVEMNVECQLDCMYFNAFMGTRTNNKNGDSIKNDVNVAPLHLQTNSSNNIMRKH